MNARGCVLVVEDDPELRAIYREILSDGGWEVLAAADGVHALELLDGDGRTPCVVLLDLRMPRMDGWQLAERLRADEHWQKLPIIVLAAHFRIADEARRLGAYQWLQKPVEIDRLLHAVRAACGSREAA